MIDRFALERTTYVPKELKPGILYVSEEYGVAAHLCACGCGSKVTTPLSPVAWTFTEHNGQPSLTPSIGNWQLPCRSHYVIYRGTIRWHGQWSDAQVLAGRRAEQRRRETYYAQRDSERRWWVRLWKLVRDVFGPRG
jgi:hypothetical protein